MPCHTTCPPPMQDEKQSVLKTLPYSSGFLDEYETKTKKRPTALRRSDTGPNGWVEDCGMGRLGKGIGYKK